MGVNFGALVLKFKLQDEDYCCMNVTIGSQGFFLWTSNFVNVNPGAESGGAEVDF